MDRRWWHGRSWLAEPSGPSSKNQPTTGRQSGERGRTGLPTRGDTRWLASAPLPARLHLPPQATQRHIARPTEPEPWDNVALARTSTRYVVVLRSRESGPDGLAHAPTVRPAVAHGTLRPPATATVHPRVHARNHSIPIARLSFFFP